MFCDNELRVPRRYLPQKYEPFANVDLKIPNYLKYSLENFYCISYKIRLSIKKRIFNCYPYGIAKNSIEPQSCNSPFHILNNLINWKCVKIKEDVEFFAAILQIFQGNCHNKCIKLIGFPNMQRQHYNYSNGAVLLPTTDHDSTKSQASQGLSFPN